MVDTHEGQEWWQASDQKWYPPESHPDYVSSLPAPPTGYLPATTDQSAFDSARSSQPERRWAPRVKARHLLIIGICVAYVVSPLDFAPEALLGPLGLPDDLIAVVAAIGVYVTRIRGRGLPDS